MQSPWNHSLRINFCGGSAASITSTVKRAVIGSISPVGSPFGSIALTRRLVMDGCGCTLLPLAAVADEVAAGRLKAYRLVEPEVRRSVGLVLGRTRTPPAALWEAARLVRAQAAALVQSGAWPDARLADG